MLCGSVMLPLPVKGVWTVPPAVISVTELPLKLAMKALLAESIATAVGPVRLVV